MKLTGENRRTRGEMCPSATLSTTNPTWTGLGSKTPGLRGGRPAANPLSHGTALHLSYIDARAAVELHFVLLMHTLPLLWKPN
jgi:hypothetical protein